MEQNIVLTNVLNTILFYHFNCGTNLIIYYKMSFVHYLEQNNFDQCQQMIDTGFDINTHKPNGYSILDNAIINQRGTDLIKFLLKNKATSKYALFLAIASGRVDVITLLLDHNANTNTRDGIGDTPLYIAIMAKKHQGIDLLLMHGADVNSINNDGVTPLHRAVDGGDLTIINRLLDRGANPNIGDSPLKSAIFQNRYDIIRTLLDHKAYFCDIRTNDQIILNIFKEYNVAITKPARK